MPSKRLNGRDRLISVFRSEIRQAWDLCTRIRMLVSRPKDRQGIQDLRSTRHWGIMDEILMRREEQVTPGRHIGHQIGKCKILWHLQIWTQEHTDTVQVEVVPVGCIHRLIAMPQMTWQHHNTQSSSRGMKTISVRPTIMISLLGSATPILISTMSSRINLNSKRV